MDISQVPILHSDVNCTFAQLAVELIIIVQHEVPIKPPKAECSHYQRISYILQEACYNRGRTSQIITTNVTYYAGEFSASRCASRVLYARVIERLTHNTRSFARACIASATLEEHVVDQAATFAKACADISDEVKDFYHLF